MHFAQTLRDALHAQAPHARCRSRQAASRAARATSAARRRAAQQTKPRHFPHPRASLARSLARSLLCSRAMAAVDVSRVVALTNKAVTLESRAHWARAAEINAEAVTAAQALQQPDCVIVAHLQAAHANSLLGHANTAGVPAARRVELSRSAYLELLPAAMASLQRRLAAGTLLAGACRPYEVAWCAAHAKAVAPSMRDAAVREPSTAEETLAWTAHVGYNAYIITAGVALKLCAAGTHLYTAQALNLQEATAVACSVFVERAFDIIQLRTGGVTVLEAALVRRAQIYIEEEQRFNRRNVRVARAYPRRLAPPAEQRRAVAT
jgi:hypothetical protein